MLVLLVMLGSTLGAASTTADGSFRATSTLDPRFEGVSGTTATMSPVKASTQISASARYTIVK